MAEAAFSGAHSAQRHLVRGASWIFVLRWGLRLNGLVTTIIVARLLTPADYGVVAIAALIVGIIEVFGNAGQWAAIVRHPNPTRAHYDAAWTISLMFAFALGLIMLAATPLTVIYFHEPRSKLVLEFLALRMALSGFENIGTVNFQRNLQFHKQVLFRSSVAGIGFVVVVGSALLLRNYWALVIGILGKEVATIALSYVMEPYRPRLSTSKIPELFSFSFWILFRGIGTYVQDNIDRLAIGGFAGTDAMGRYNVGRDVASNPVNEANYPILSALFPVMVKVSHDRAAQRELVQHAIYWSAVICTSISIGVAVVASDMVDLILGPKWSAVKPLVPWLSLYYGVGGLTASVYQTLEAMGAAGTSARLQWLRVFGLSIVVIPAAWYFRDLQAVAIANFLVGLAIAPSLFRALGKALDIRMVDFVQMMWRPFAAAFAMAAALNVLNSAIPFSGLPRLGVDVIAGAAVFGTSLMMLWFIVGRPEGPERWVHAGLHHCLARFVSVADAETS